MLGVSFPKLVFSSLLRSSAPAAPPAFPDNCSCARLAQSAFRQKPVARPAWPRIAFVVVERALVTRRPVRHGLIHHQDANRKGGAAVARDFIHIFDGPPKQAGAGRFSTSSIHRRARCRRRTSSDGERHASFPMAPGMPPVPATGRMVKRLIAEYAR